MQLIELLARLSKLTITPSEKKKLEKQLPEIIEYISQVKTLDTSDLTPTYHTNIKETVLREDKQEANRILKKSDILKNAKRTQDTYFVVDAVL